MPAPFSAFRTVPALGQLTAAYGYQILTTDLVVFVALEALADHSTRRTADPFHDGSNLLTLGDVTSRPLPRWIAELEPGSDERRRFATITRGINVLDARNVIGTAYPAVAAEVEAGNARWRGGELECDTATGRRIVGVATPVAA